jgi:hypothetical protein
MYSRMDLSQIAKAIDIGEDIGGPVRIVSVENPARR